MVDKSTQPMMCDYERNDDGNAKLVDGELVHFMRPLTDEEQAEYDERQQLGQQQRLEKDRANARAAILALLAASDRFAARAYEEGVPMTSERISYRRDLRSLIATVATSDDPAAIELPPEPRRPTNLREKPFRRLSAQQSAPRF
jgi:hypothetical protein